MADERTDFDDMLAYMSAEETDDDTEQPVEEDAELDDNSQHESEDDDNAADDDEQSEEGNDEDSDESEAEDDESEETDESNADNKDPRDSVIEQLKNQISELTKFVSVAAVPATPKGEPPQPKQEKQEPTRVEKLVGDTDFEELQSDGKALGKFIADIVTAASEDTKQQLTQGQPTVEEQVARLNQQANLKSVVDQFYEDNEDLAQVKQTVSVVAKSVGQENPTWKLDKVLEEAAKRTRTMLGYAVKKTKNTIKRNGKPSVPKKSGKARTGMKPKPQTKLQKDLDAMVKSARG